MRLDAIAEHIGATLVAGDGMSTADICRVCATNRMSDLLDQIDDHTLLVTGLPHAALVRPVELMDVPGICLLNGASPDPGLAQVAAAHGAVLMISPGDMHVTCARLHELLGSDAAEGSAQ
jgi:hypothetical protein